MKLISVWLIVTIAAMGCATGPRPEPIDPTAPRSWTDPPEPVALSNGIAADAPPPQGMSTGQILGTIALVTLLLPVAVLVLAYSGSSGGWYRSRTYTSTIRYDTGRVTTYKTTITGNHSTTRVSTIRR